MSDTKTLTAERLDEIALAKWSGPIVKDWDELITLARQGLRVPELEAQVARLQAKRDRYRKVAELAREARIEVAGYIPQWAEDKWHPFADLDAALAAVGMEP